MRTSLINPALWLLALTAVAAAAGAIRRRSAAQSLQQVAGWATSTPILALLLAMALFGLGSRVVLGYLAPGTYAEDVVGARAFLAERRVYRADDRAELKRWLSEEPAAAMPWTLPGITPCQASALEQRPQFFTSQGHMPTLLLASVPLVHVLGGRGLYVALALGALAGVAVIVSVLLRECGLSWRSRAGLLLLAALSGWQPVLAGIRQGDAVVMAAALAALSWHLVRRGRSGAAGVSAGVAACLVLPALGALPALLRHTRRAGLAAAATLGAGGGAAIAAGGPLLLSDFAHAASQAALTYAGALPNYAVVGRALLAGADARVLIAVFTLAGVASAIRGRSADGWFGAFLSLGLLAAPIVWSQHLTLALVPLTVLLKRVRATGTSLALAGWAVVAMVLSLPDPAVAYLSEWLALPSATAAVPPVVPVALVALWLAVLFGPEGTLVERPAHAPSGAAAVLP